METKLMNVEINLDKKGFIIEIDGEQVGMVFAKDEVEALADVYKGIENGIIETNGTSVIKVLPLKDEVKILADWQDPENNFHYVTLEEGKQFLYDLWEDNEDEFDSEEEHEQFLNGIWDIKDWDELDDRLEGCEYGIFDNEEDLKDWEFIPITKGENQ